MSFAFYLGSKFLTSNQETLNFYSNDYSKKYGVLSDGCLRSQVEMLRGYTRIQRLRVEVFARTE